MESVSAWTDLIQVVQCNYLLRGKWQTEWQFGPGSRTLYCYDYLYSPHWFPDDIMTCNFHKQSPWEEARCSFESHDFSSLLHPGCIVFFSSPRSLILYSPLPSVLPLPRAHMHKQMGISKKLKSHFWLQFNPFLFFFSPKASGTEMANSWRQSWVSTLVRTFTRGNSF